MTFLKRFLRRKQAKPRPVSPTLVQKGPVAGRMEVGWSTDIGRQRKHNEDAVLVVEASQEGDNALPTFGLFVLADGMGGHQAGEVASALAARITARHIVQQVYLTALSQQGHSADQPSLKEVLIEAVNLANAAVAAAVPGGGTTLICTLMLGPQAYVANVGDSRAYLVSRESMEQITRDHSLVDRLVEMGQLTAAEATNHPQKNVLYRAVGQGGVLEVDTFVHGVPPDHFLLLCSDGLWGMVNDEEMLRIVNEAPSPQAACDALVVAANGAGGSDNVSAILVRPPVGQ
jgi:serine/threonine protein phosphatase PrpC